MDIDFKELLDNMVDAIAVYDSNGSSIYYNKAMLALLDRDSPQFRSIYKVKNEGSFSDLAVIDVLEKKVSINKQIIYKGKKIILSTASPILNNDGTIRYIISHAVDITKIIQENEYLVDKVSDNTRYVQELAFLKSYSHKNKEIGFIAESSITKKIFLRMLRAAPTDAPILLLGESGTGKSLLARCIHQASDRDSQPFIAINCGALPANIIEAELFGYEKGSFTGANSRKLGLFECANNGTLFLDEITELPYELQTRFLSALQDKTIRRLGSTHDIPVNVRIISATNRNIEKEISVGKFRQDLYYRLNTICMELPPLRDRPADLAYLIVFFLNKFNKKYKKNAVLSSAVFSAMSRYTWPGNIRELENTLESMIIMSYDRLMDIDMLPPKLMEYIPSRNTGTGETLQSVAEQAEKDLLLRVLQDKKTIRAIAKQLQTSYSTISRKLNKYGLTCSNEVTGKEDAFMDVSD